MAIVLQPSSKLMYDSKAEWPSKKFVIILGLGQSTRRMHERVIATRMSGSLPRNQVGFSSVFQGRREMKEWPFR